MDFINFMNQIGVSGTGCGNVGGDSTFLNNNCASNLLPFLLLSGLTQNSRNNGNVVCYPNCQSQPQQYVTQTSVPCCDSQVKYRTRKVRQAYMEVPVSTYQVAQPYYGQQQLPISFNMASTQGNMNSNMDLYTLLLILALFNKGSKSQICHPIPQPRGGRCSTTEL